MPIEDFIISVFCCVDDMLKMIMKGKQLRQRGIEPKLTDSEVITMEIVGEFLGLDRDTATWRYFNSHWRTFFPRLSSRSAFAKQSANLWRIKQIMQVMLASQLYAFDDTIHLIDGFPIPVCQFARAHFRKGFKTEASYGYCASKKEKYCGFKGNLMISLNGVISGFTLTAAKVDERHSIFDVIKNVRGLLIGDKGLMSSALQSELKKEFNIDLHTPLRDNMIEQRHPAFVKKIISTRRLIETVIGQLVEQFNIAKIRARDLWHLTNRIARKLLSHTMSVFLNRQQGRAFLQLQGLLDT